MGQDAFDILRVTPRFDLNAEELNQAYLAAAAAIHPDLAAGSDTAPQQMAEVNEARRVLGNPEKRADLLLRKLGGPSAEREKGLPEGFLAEVMSLRLEIEEGLGESDATKKEAHRQRWESWARDQRETATKEVAELFRKVADASPERAEALRRVRIRLNAWRYLERLLEQLDPGFNARAGL